MCVAKPVVVVAVLLVGPTKARCQESSAAPASSGATYAVVCRIVGNSGKPFTAPKITVRDGQTAKLSADTLAHPVIVAVKGDGYEKSAVVEPVIDGTTISATVSRVDANHVVLDLSAELSSANEEPSKVEAPGVKCQAIEFNSVKRRRVENVELGKTFVMKMPDAGRFPWRVEVTVAKDSNADGSSSAATQTPTLRNASAVATTYSR